MDEGAAVALLLWKIRQRLGLSQKKIASAVGVSEKCWNNWERNMKGTVPKRTAMKRILELKITLAEKRLLMEAYFDGA